MGAGLWEESLKSLASLAREIATGVEGFSASSARRYDILVSLSPAEAPKTRAWIGSAIVVAVVGALIQSEGVLASTVVVGDLHDDGLQ